MSARRKEIAGPLERVSVIANNEIAPGVFILKLPRRHDFSSGQTIALTVDPQLPARYYSIASGRGEPEMEILFDYVPTGLLTPRLAGLRAGDAVYASPPFGTFRDGESLSVWIAAGTGVAPFASMARSGLVQGKTLIHGSRTMAGLYFREYFSAVLEVSYIPCCSGENDGTVFPGRLTAYLSREQLPDSARYLLCGSAQMAVEVRDLLIARGVPFANVIAEIYF